MTMTVKAYSRITELQVIVEFKGFVQLTISQSSMRKYAAEFL